MGSSPTIFWVAQLLFCMHHFALLLKLPFNIMFTTAQSGPGPLLSLVGTVDIIFALLDGATNGDNKV